MPETVQSPIGSPERMPIQIYSPERMPSPIVIPERMPGPIESPEKNPSLNRYPHYSRKDANVDEGGPMENDGTNSSFSVTRK